MSGWSRPIFTDSGGFQIYSLIHENPKHGTISDKGATFRPSGEKKFNLTPEKSVQLQFGYDSDMIICLDDCTHAEADMATQEASVRRTILWAERCKATYVQLVEDKRLSETERPLLMGVIQGGLSPELRRTCAEALLEIGFDAYGYGGWPLDGDGNLLVDMLALTRELVPDVHPLHALGVGHPAFVAASSRIGYQLFDSTMPTRDARHGRLLTFTADPTTLASFDGDGWFRFLYPNDDRHVKETAPVSPYCDCPCCARYSLGYLHHLYRLRDTLYFRLATAHNLRFMTQLMTGLRRTLPV